MCMKSDFKILLKFGNSEDNTDSCSCSFYDIESSNKSFF